MEYGYCRISTGKQSIQRQITNIQKAYPNAVIKKEVYTGTKDDRPVFQNLIKMVKAGDTIIFDSVSRMSRNKEEGVKDYLALYEKDINLKFLKEPYIDTDVYRSAKSQRIDVTGNDIADIYIAATNKVIEILAQKQILEAFEQSEKEVSDLRRRTSEGLREAKLNGKQIGTKKGSKLCVKKKDPAKKKILEYSKDFNGELSDKDTIKLCGIARNTYYKYKRELMEENGI